MIQSSKTALLPCRDRSAWQHSTLKVANHMTNELSSNEIWDEGTPKWIALGNFCSLGSVYQLMQSSSAPGAVCRKGEGRREEEAATGWGLSGLSWRGVGGLEPPCLVAHPSPLLQFRLGKPQFAAPPTTPPSLFPSCRELGGGRGKTVSAQPGSQDRQAGSIFSSLPPPHNSICKCLLGQEGCSNSWLFLQSAMS